MTSVKASPKISEQRSTAIAYTALTLAALMFASNHVIGRAVHNMIPPIGLSFWRWVTGGLILLPFVWGDVRKRWPLLVQNSKVLTILGFFMMSGTTLVLVALSQTSAINVSLINAIQPTLTVLLAYLLFRHVPGLQRMLGIACGFGGVAVVVTRADLQALINLDLVTGDFIALLAMFAFAGYALTLPRLPRELGGLTVLFAIAVTGTLMLLPVYIWESLFIGTVPVTVESVGAILALALLVSVLGNLNWNTGNRIIGPARAAIFINLIPVFGTLLAFVFLGERPRAYQAVGGVLVIVGLILAAGRRARFGSDD